MSTFKATAFRSSSGTQYGDQLWLNGLGTIATPSTEGRTVALKAAYLEDGDAAIPSVFGSLSWTAPTEEALAQCTVNVYDGFDVAPAMTIDLYEAKFNGDCRVAGTVYAASGSMSSLTVDGGVLFPSILQDPSASNILTWDPSTGEVGYMSMTSGNELIDTIPVLTISEDLRLPNAPTARTSYSLYIEPMTGSIFKAETPYEVTTVDGVANLVAFPGNVSASNVSATSLHVSDTVVAANILRSGGHVEAGNLVQIGSGSDVWRLRPDAASGALIVEKREGGIWVAKTLIGTV